MLFNSFVFIGLLVLTFGLYYLPLLSRWQRSILILSSTVFYSYHQPAMVGLLLMSVLVNALASYLIAHDPGVNRVHMATLGIIFNTGLLVVFKYSSLLILPLGLGPNPLTTFLLGIPLPLGISFFTFQGISLLVDVKKENYFRNEQLIPRSFWHHFERIFLFEAFFAHAIAGPIVKAHDFLPQISPKKLSTIHWETTTKALITGYFLKMVVADNLKDFTVWLAYPYFQQFSGSTLVLLVFGYYFQLFADFAGYSLIAIGLARMFGYSFKPNFNFPLLATSFRELWTRWHISLTNFLREYLFLPIVRAGSGKWRRYFGMLFVMIVAGLWHGATWNFALWGALHGAALVLENILTKKKILMMKSPFLKFLKGIFIFLFSVFSLILFKFSVLHDSLELYKTIQSNTFWFFYSSNDTKIVIYTLLYIAPVGFYYFMHFLKKTSWYRAFLPAEFLIYAFLFFLIIVNSGMAKNFIYFQF
ncbi:MBOAT family O-acyltransferase [Arundinibacter roseus]|uniref:MBOAT family protein n=1 Tax=Arundinibacter roseus TaxID=2070510 RepID=A0A4R4K3L5_9BACT|nr:MBOAT family O-acyltransferase [Arundinibacter roseus]TDB61793.1 MBOAT family protein [Arundinibacter roseus]